MFDLFFDTMSNFKGLRVSSENYVMKLCPVGPSGPNIFCDEMQKGNITFTSNNITTSTTTAATTTNNNNNNNYYYCY